MKRYKLEVMGIFGSRRAVYYDELDQAYQGLFMIKRLGGFALVKEWDPDQGMYKTICGG